MDLALVRRKAIIWTNEDLILKTHICANQPQWVERKCSHPKSVGGWFECPCWITPLRWRHNGRDSVSNHQPYDCLLNRLFRRRSMKISKLYVTGLCAGNSPETGEFLEQMASNAENVSIWWRHHDTRIVSRHRRHHLLTCNDGRRRPIHPLGCVSRIRTWSSCLLHFHGVRRHAVVGGYSGRVGWASLPWPLTGADPRVG